VCGDEVLPVARLHGPGDLRRIGELGRQALPPGTDLSDTVVVVSLVEDVGVGGETADQGIDIADRRGGVVAGDGCVPMRLSSEASAMTDMATPNRRPGSESLLADDT
jgi:hypothetical protein